MAAQTTPGKQTVLQRLAQTTPIWVALASVMLVLLMIVPVPPWLLDFLLSVNISHRAGHHRHRALHRERAAVLSVFPTLLLIITLFRLSLNITATRSILLTATPARSFNSSGTIVVGGNYAVGFVIFLILVVIQFVVITNGAGRVAEVAARFTLDAMPGKQLAIDADLNAGLITEAEARQRRKDIQRVGRLLRRDGRCQQVRSRRRDRRADHRGHQHIGGFIVGVAQHALADRRRAADASRC